MPAASTASTASDASPAPPLSPTAARAARDGADETAPHLLALSARDEGALRQLAGRWRERLAEPDAAAALAELCFTANAGRAQLPQRLAVRGTDAAGLQAALAAWLGGGQPNGLVSGRAAPAAPKVAFLFTGQGAQHHGMARGLYRTAPVFRETLERCATVLDGLLDVPLLELLFGDTAAASRIDDTAYAQPALFAVEVALAALWRSWGIAPAVVLGHSLGEYAAACVAGIFPLEDALRVLVRRGRLTQNLPGEGAMVSVPASEAELRDIIAALGVHLDFAAYNGAEQIVLSGTRHAIDALTARLDREGRRWRALRISHGFHSSLVEPALAPLGEELRRVRFGAARCAVVSNLRGTLAATGEMGEPGYWLQQMRQPVRFAEGLRTLLDQGVTHVIEVGPHPVLLGLALEEVPPETPVHWLPTLRRDAPEGTDLLEAVQRLFVDGARIDWHAFARGRAQSRLRAPLMPFQHRRYWIERAPVPTPERDSAPAGAAPGVPPGDRLWRSLSAALARQSDQAPIGTNVSGYAERWAVLERLTVAHAASVLREAGLFAAAGEAHDVESVRARLGAKQTYAHLLERWLQRLADRGELRRDGRHFVSERPLADPQIERCIADTRAALADNPTLLEYVLHCGRLLPAVIGDRQSPLETLFPGGSFALAEGIYQRSSPMRYINTLAASAIEALVAARGAAPLRVLEIGAGTGSTTAALVPVLAEQAAPGTRYCYTDVTPVFFDLARDKFSAVPFMQFAEFDLERDAAAQGFGPASFDVVVAANAVHATRDLRAALRSIRTLLAPGGVLLLVESTEHLAWYDMTTGLIEGWQHFADDLRTDNPLLPAPSWLRALREAGFDEAGAWPSADHEAAAMGQQVVAAWVAGAAPAAVAAVGAEDAQAPGAAASAGKAAAAPAGVADEPADASAAAGLPALRERLRLATPEEQRGLLRDAVRDTVAAVLRLGPHERPGRHDRLMDLGMDSLMAVQLRNRFAKMLGLTRPLPATLMFDHPTVDALSAYLQPLVQDDAPAVAGVPVAAAAAPAAGAVPTPLGVERVAEMSDAEIELLLLERLDKQT